MPITKPLIIVLLGPTGSGKTELGIEIGEKLGLEIHNIDSRQIYLDMDIGTAKPSKEQQQRIKHFLIDLTPPNEPITMHQFQKLAWKSLEKTLPKNNIGLLVGGSGLYLKALTHGLCPPAIPPQPFLRKQLQNFDPITCHQILKTCDPISSQKISPLDSVRTIRALEVFYATGQTINTLQSMKPPSWKVIELGLKPSNLQDRILERTKKMFKNGIIEETNYLIQKFGKELPLLNTIGYEEACKFIHGQIDLDLAITNTNKRTNQFAKRQKTWFKGQHNPQWLNSDNPLCEALSLIHNVIG